MRKEVKINSEGRIVIPAEMRKAININDDDVLLITLNYDKSLTLIPKQSRCGICNATEELTEHNNIILCKQCIESLQKII